MGSKAGGKARLVFLQLILSRYFGGSDIFTKDSGLWGNEVCSETDCQCGKSWPGDHGTPHMGLSLMICPKRSKCVRGKRQIQAHNASRQPLSTLPHALPTVLSVPSEADLPPTSAQAGRLLTLIPLRSLSFVNSHIVFHLTSQVPFSGKWPDLCPLLSHLGGQGRSFYSTLDFPWSIYQGFHYTSVWVLTDVYFFH